MRPTELFDLGYTDLVSVIPPSGALSPSSRVRPEQRGKVPGRKNQSGTWGGYDWLAYQATREDVKQWEQDAANIGLKARRFPALDIDSLDRELVLQVLEVAERTLGPAPARSGRKPKILLPYRLEGDAFARMGAILTKPDTSEHLVEVLGDGRQYLLEGDHPSGSAYQWNTPLPAPAALTPITYAQVLEFFAALEIDLAMYGVTVRRVGTGQVADARDQDDLKAPSIEALRECVAAIPNTNALFPSRDSYIKMGEAIHAACGTEEEEGFEIFSEWSTRWEGNGRYDGNAPETVRSDWRRLRPPHRVGWGWLSTIAVPFGYNAAAHVFDTVGGAVSGDSGVAGIGDNEPPAYSDAWLADKVIEEYGDVIRYVPATNCWYVYGAGRWGKDAILKAEALIDAVLRRLAALVIRQGATEKERKAAQALADKLCSAHRAAEVRRKMRPDSRIATPVEAFDADPWVLNTPGGLVDLRTGILGSHNPDALCSRQTDVAPDFEMPTTRWDQFLTETTGGDPDLISYLQAFCGYALTGVTSEQILPFLYGRGGNGKGRFLYAISGILKDYAEEAAMDTFTASAYDRHPTDIASLAGARLVTAVETQEGRTWDEQRVKALTGGDRIKARFMRQDFFTFIPQFKILIAGNHQPGIRNLDAAMRRRIHLVPFTQEPRVRDGELDDKLKREWPGILAWMIAGCVRWQMTGLQQPQSVLLATEEYFAQEDPGQQWIDERCHEREDLRSPLLDLFNNYREWANARGEHERTMKGFSQMLTGKKFPRYRDGVTGRMGFVGLALKPSEMEALLT